jgi:hypothetical protein
MKVIAEGRELLERLAARHGLDGVMEIYMVQEGVFPESSAQKAFALLGFGEPIYREMAHDRYFPAKSRSARRTGARGVRASLALPAGERAVIFMSHAVTAYAVAFWECAARRGDIDDYSVYEDYHGSIRQLLREFYPVDADDEQALADARREVDVFTTHVPVDAPELPSRTGYNKALLEGKDPDRDPELVATHASTALHIFRLSTQNHALRLGLGDDGYRTVERDLLSAWDLGRAALIWRAVIDAYWAEVVGDYFEFVRPPPETPV